MRKSPNVNFGAEARFCQKVVAQAVSKSTFRKFGLDENAILTQNPVFFSPTWDFDPRMAANPAVHSPPRTILKLDFVMKPVPPLPSPWGGVGEGSVESLKYSLRLKV